MICELANMVCGATLSRLEPDAIHDLMAPTRLDAAHACGATGNWVQRFLALDSGVVALALEWES